MANGDTTNLYPSIAELLGWVNQPPGGAGGGSGQRNLNQYLTNLLKTGEKYGSVLDEGALQYQYKPMEWEKKEGEWGYKNRYTGQTRRDAPYGGFHGGSWSQHWIPTEGSYKPGTTQYGTMDLSLFDELLASEDFTGMHKEGEGSLSEKVMEILNQSTEGLEGDLTYEHLMKQLDGGEYGLDISGLSNLSSRYRESEEWNPSFTGSSWEELEESMAIGDDETIQDALYRDYENWYDERGMGSSADEDKLSKETFLSGLTPGVGFGEDWDISGVPEAVTDIGFETEAGQESDYKTILDYLQALQEGRKAITSAEKSFRLEDKLAAIQGRTGRDVEAAKILHAGKEPTLRYGALQGNINPIQGMLAQDTLERDIAEANRAKSMGTRTIWEQLSKAGFGGIADWFESV